MILIELFQSYRQPLALPALRRQPQVRPRLLARLDAGGDQNVQRLRLLQRIDRVVADPDEFEIGRGDIDLCNIETRILDSRAQRRRPFQRE